MNDAAHGTAIQRHTGTDWRLDRPPEDPEKTKRWGLITAKPSEYLVHVRRGRVLRTSGQGASCFKWPWDSVAVVPTSLQRLSFTADQVTVEKVGVQVTGLAVYRIAEPLIAYRVLNFSFVERAQQKLEDTLTAMLVGATRRLVANLAVEDVLTKRKEALAGELLGEIAPVVGGEGRPEDETDQGWGVVVDTIEIQDVRVLSESVFAAMQAPFRAALDRAAREARAESERRGALAEADAERQVRDARTEATKQGALREAEAEREVSEARLAANAALAARRTAVEREQAEACSQDAIRAAEREQAEAARRTELARELAEQAARDAARRAGLAAEEAEAELATSELRARAAQARAEREQSAHAAALALRRAEAEASHEAGLREAEVAAARARAEQELAVARARVLTAERLPDLAAAVGERFGEVKLTHIGGDASPFGSIAQAVLGVLELAAAARGDQS